MARVLLLWFFCFSSDGGNVFSLRSGSLAARLSTPTRNETNETFDCTGFQGGGACTRCATWEDDVVGALVYYVQCLSCQPGHVLRRAEDEPGVAVNFTHNNIHHFWTSLCVPLKGEERRLIMVRHGESIWNELMERTNKLAGAIGVWKGKDSPLSPLGLRQAQRLANVLKKAGEKVYKPTPLLQAIETRDDFLKTLVARADLDAISLESTLTIKRKADDKLLTDDDMRDNLAREENRDELDVLLGRRCSDTNFVTSQLARAMDTFLIATIESRLQCAAPWLISSNLQEIEHNLDCTPKATPGNRPTIRRKQEKSYYVNGMGHTKEYIAARYAESDVSRYKKNFGQVERARWNDQSEQMHDELAFMFESPKHFNVWGGHSIWFRHFFQEFADLGSPVCKELQDIKMANTAMVSVRLKKVDDAVSKMGYAAYDCKWLHLGSSDDFKLKLNHDILDRATVPEAGDFDHGVESIMGWKCCCSRSDHKDARVWISKRRSLEKCVLVFTEHCSSPSTWKHVFQQHNLEFIQQAHNYDWGYNKGPCTA